MANLKVKNNAGTEVVYNNVDQIVMPTTDGGTATFRQWNGYVENAAPAVAYKKQNIMLASAYTPTEPTITIEKESA